MNVCAYISVFPVEILSWPDASSKDELSEIDLLS
jgi:hypothetical protein